MSGRDIVVVGASAGGVPALLELAKGLRDDFQASVFVAVHGSPDGPGLLPELLTRAGRLPASHPVSGEAFRRANGRAPATELMRREPAGARRRGGKTARRHAR